MRKKCYDFKLQKSLYGTQTISRQLVQVVGYATQHNHYANRSINTGKIKEAF